MLETLNLVLVFTMSSPCIHHMLDCWMNGRSPLASVKHPRGLQHGSSCQASGKPLETHIESQRLVTGLGVDPLFQKGQVACWFSGGV